MGKGPGTTREEKEGHRQRIPARERKTLHPNDDTYQLVAAIYMHQPVEKVQDLQPERGECLGVRGEYLKMIEEDPT